MAPRMVSVKLVFLKFSEKVNFVDFEKGNKIFDFRIGIPSQNLKLKNHLKTLTMVSMETKTVRILFWTGFLTNFI